MVNFRKVLFIYIPIIFLSVSAFGQISPGELSNPHAHLEGMSNCTQCHDLGEHVSDQKCLACHKELKSRIEQKKGFHASSKVGNKGCITCHSEHLSRKYDIVHLEKEKFDHQETGWTLTGKHKEKKCDDCHKAERITNQEIKKKKMTFLGLDPECKSCHEDYHQKTLSTDCASCHSTDAFKPVTKFDHSKSKFILKGKHMVVECSKCHEITALNGKKFQKFKDIKFNSCVNCHKDVHNNKFGPNCSECHSEESFKSVKGISSFDHNKTNFKLEGKHSSVACKLCHKISLTAPLKYARCMDCHSDFHKGQFVRNGLTPDCRECHDQKGFQGSSFTFERHNTGTFKLEGAHAATPCITCHKKGNEWQFSDLNKSCKGCHNNIHKGYFEEKYYPEERCDICHSVTSWNKVNFDHKITTFELKGKHQEKTCRDCHIKRENEFKLIQHFSDLTGNCEECHTDVHRKQFYTTVKVDCTACHGGFDNWKADRFDHNNARFKLDGSHKAVACRKCHFENKTGKVSFILYKNNKLECINCHF
jgi:hypothetical protein